jgi:hypothetical protein
MDLSTKDYGFGTKSYGGSGSGSGNAFKGSSSSNVSRHAIGSTSSSTGGGLNLFKKPKYETREQEEERLRKEEQVRQLAEAQKPESFPTLMGGTEKSVRKRPILAPNYVSAAERIRMVQNANLEKQDVSSPAPVATENRIQILKKKIMNETKVVASPEKISVKAKWDDDGIDEETGFIHSEWASCLDDDMYDEYHRIGSKALEDYEDDYVYDYDIDTDTFACREFGGRRLHYGEYNAMVRRMEEEAKYDSDDGDVGNQYRDEEYDSYDEGFGPYGDDSDNGYESEDSVTNYNYF